MDTSTLRAAILLWNVMKTASNEMDEKRLWASSFMVDSANPPMTSAEVKPVVRPRLVSIGSSDATTLVAASPTSSRNVSPLIHPITPIKFSDHDMAVVLGKPALSPIPSCESPRVRGIRTPLNVPKNPYAKDMASSSDEMSLPLSQRVAPPVFVGKKLAKPLLIKATLRKKFAWKHYPELENYLICHRAEYLKYSASLNYTAEQKRYNNKLTNGLLDTAVQYGYVFESFTFPMVRDRIRCYYKSYVQAARKKQRRNNG